MNHLINRRINIVNALAGAGKTYQAFNWALKQAHDNSQKTVIVFKTNLLIGEAWKDIHEFKEELGSNVPITRINGDHLGNDHRGSENISVRGAILDHLNHGYPISGEVLFITESAFMDLPWWPKRSKWHCVLDEIPNVSSAHQLRVPDNHRILTDHIDTNAKSPSHSLVSVIPGHEKHLKSLADNPSRSNSMTCVMS